MKTLVILHGWQSSKEKWQKVKEGLEREDLKVIVPDIPGFKPETELEKPWNLDDYLEWFNNFSQKDEPFFLLGHSFGGRISIKFAAKYPEKLKGLILCSSAGIRPRKGVRGSIILKIAKMGKLIFGLPLLKRFYPFFQKIFYGKILRKWDYLEAKGIMKEVFKNVIDEDLTPCLSQIKVPTLLIWGENDKTTPLKDAYLMQEKIENSQLEILEKIGHSPHRESPMLLVQIIKKCLGQT